MKVCRQKVQSKCTQNDDILKYQSLIAVMIVK